MHEHAEVVGLEEQLTVPTRHTPHLFDLWISLRWNASHTEWTKEFAIDAERHNAARSSTGSMQLVHMSDRQGWIVARGVDLVAVAPREVEALVRRVVARVNERNAVTPNAAPPRSSQPTWSNRVRTSVATGAAGLVGLVVAPRDRSADIAPN
ncbi:MAG: hypothetical protein JWM95_4333 [Gemmatimonadetes bacterium]|nr:hypothetical protein [Gemmatimonadota bacterium]